MTTNLAESINAVFKGVRFLPVLGLVRATFYRLTKYWVQRAEKATAQLEAGETISEDIRLKLATRTRRASACTVRAFDRRGSTFEVEEPYDPTNQQFGRSCKINLVARTCDCGEFQALKYPCQHVLAACAHIRVDHVQYIDEVFRLETILKAYEIEFRPIGGEVYWPQVRGPTLIPDPAMKRGKGRPKSSRIRNEMDWREAPRDLPRCALCRQTGHNRTTCPSRCPLHP